MASDNNGGGIPAPDVQMPAPTPNVAEVGGDGWATEPEGEAVADAAPAEEPEGVAKEGEDGAGEDAEEAPKPKKEKQKASDRIRELNAKLREAERRAESAEQQNLNARIAELEKRLQYPESGTTVDQSRVAPDPSDLKKYPLGRLDDRYIEDQIAFKAEELVEKALGSDRQRQAEREAQAHAEQAANAILEKVSGLAEKGTPLFDDFMETVIEPGMRSDYKLTQETFEAVCEVEHGAEVLRGLALNKAEAARVASLSPYQQIKYVTDKNAEIAAKKTQKRIPGANPPPQSTPRGAGGKFTSVNVESYSDVKKALLG